MGGRRENRIPFIHSFVATITVIIIIFFFSSSEVSIWFLLSEMHQEKERSIYPENLDWSICLKKKTDAICKLEKKINLSWKRRLTDFPEKEWCTTYKNGKKKKDQSILKAKIEASFWKRIMCYLQEWKEEKRSILKVKIEAPP
jgi:hypothetical protein